MARRPRSRGSRRWRRRPRRICAWPSRGWPRARDARPPEGKGGAGFWRGIERRLLNLVTLRHGTRLVIGRQAAVTIEAARLALAAGDLSDATKKLMTLTPPEATVFNDWLSQAQALLAARAALAQMIGAA